MHKTLSNLESVLNPIKPAGSSLANTVTVTMFAAGSISASDVSTSETSLTVKLLGSSGS
jgi:hypothetical protein